MHVAKVREYLCKIIHNIGVCGEILFRWKIFNSKKCFYCDSDSHTFKHMIWECEHCEQYWEFRQIKYIVTDSYELGENKMSNLITLYPC